ncbi:MAG: O-antigen ligase family protein, partial [Chloroflexota bacterium]
MASAAHPTKPSFAAFLAGIEIVPVGLAVGLSIVFPSFLPAAVLTAAFFWLARLAAFRRLTVRTPGDWGMLILLLMLPVTLWATALPANTQPQTLRLLSGMALYYAVANWTNSRARLHLLLPGYTLLGLGLALAAPVSVSWAVNKLPFIPAWVYNQLPAQVTDTIHPNVLGGSLAILLPPALAMLLFAWKSLSGFERLLNALAVVLMGAFLALTLSRGAWMATAAALVLLPMLRWRWGWLAPVLAAAAGGLLVYRIGYTQALHMLAASGTVGGLDGRLEIWSRAWYMIQDFVFTGIGMGSFMEVADALYPFFLYSPGSIHHAHNLFLQVAVDLGAPGFTGWMIVYGAAAWSAWITYRWGRRQGQPLYAGLGAGMLGSLLALAVHGMTDAVTWGMVRPAPIVWALWGLAV